MATVGTLTGGAIKKELTRMVWMLTRQPPLVTLRCGPQMSSYIVLFFSVFCFLPLVFLSVKNVLFHIFHISCYVYITDLAFVLTTEIQARVIFF